MSSQTNVYINEEEKAAVRHLAKALGIMSGPSGNTAGSVSGLVRKLAGAMISDPQRTTNALGQLFHETESGA